MSEATACFFEGYAEFASLLDILIKRKETAISEDEVLALTSGMISLAEWLAENEAPLDKKLAADVETLNAVMFSYSDFVGEQAWDAMNVLEEDDRFFEIISAT